MKRNSKKYRSVLAAIMAATVVFTTAAASPTYASEQTESEEVSAEVIVDTASESEEAEAVETIETESQEQDVSGDEVSAEETNADVETTEVSENVEETEVVTEAEATEETTKETEVVEATETIEQQEEELQPVTEAETETPDYDAPVIEDFALEEDGQTVTADSVLHFTAKAYDAGSGIKNIATVTTKQGSNNSYIKNMQATMVSDGVWSFTAKASDLFGSGAGQYSISLRVIDNAGLEANYSKKCQVNYEADVNFTGTMTLASEKSDFFWNEEITFNAVLPENYPAQSTYISSGKIILSKDGTTKEVYISHWNNFTDQNHTSLVLKLYNWVEIGTWNVEKLVAQVKSQNNVYDLELYPENAMTLTIKEPEESPAELVSMNFDKQGQNVKSGDVLNFEVTISETSQMPENGYLWFNAVTVNNTYAEGFSVPVERVGDTCTYKGSYTVSENLYPAEWYVSSINIQDKYGRNVKLSGYRQYYFNCINGGNFIGVTGDVTVAFYQYNSQKTGNTGNLQNDYLVDYQKINKTVTSRATLGSIVGSLPVLPDYNGEKFIGWMDTDGNLVNENSQIMVYSANSSSYYSYYPVYEKVTVNCRIMYINNEGQLVYDTETVKCPYTAKIGDVLSLLSVPADFTKDETFGGWKQTYLYDLDRSVVLINNFSAAAVPQGKKLARASYEFIGSDLNNHAQTYAMYVDENSSAKDAYEILANKFNITLPELDKEVPAELEVNGWNYSESVSDGMISCYYSPKYNKSAVVYNYLDENGNNVRQAVYGKDGEKANLPESLPGYSKVVWGYTYEEGFDPVEGDILFDYWVTFVTADPSYRNTNGGNETPAPDQGNKTETSASTETTNNSSEKENTATTNTTAAQAVTLSNEKITQSVEKISTAKAGESVEIKMGNATVAPVEVLKAAQGKDVNIVLNMGGYSWTINGKDIAASDLKAINLEVKLDQNAVAPSIVESIADGKPTRQLSLTHNGEFGFKANLSINLGAENVGQYGNMYYYDSTGRLVFMNAGKIDENGNATLSFTHASDYVIVIDKDRTAQEAAKSPETGENFPVIPVSVMVMSMLGLAFLYAKKRENF